MIREYLQLREIGHDRRTSFERAVDHLIDGCFPSFSHYNGTPIEVELEHKLTHLEGRVDCLDFQSLSDLEQLSTDDPAAPKAYRTIDELGLAELHFIYCNQREFFSPKQIQRYEKLRTGVPSKFQELLEAIETDHLEEYEQKKSDIYDAKFNEWYQKKKKKGLHQKFITG